MPNPMPEFEWLEEKNHANVREHGIRFQDAVQIVDRDPLIFRSSRGKGLRWQAIELLEGRAISGIFTERAGRRRIISARPASRSERRSHIMDRGEIPVSLQVPEPPWDESKQVPDEEIDFSDHPEPEEWEWKYARRMSHPEAFSKELSDAYDAEWRERNRQKLAQQEEPNKP